MDDVALLKSSCMRFRAAFLGDNRIDPFRGSTITVGRSRSLL